MLLPLCVAAPAAAQAPLDRATVLLEEGRYADALRAVDAADSGPAATDPSLPVRAELIRGSVWQARGFPRVAAGHFQLALDRAQRGGGPALAADAYGALASACSDLGQWSRVLDYTERQHEADPRHTPAAEFRYFFQRGVAYAEFEDGEHAEENLARALAIGRASGDARSVSTALGELAAVYADFHHDLPRALVSYDEALAIARTARLRDLEATWLLDSGAALRDAEQYDEARPRLEQALAVERASGARRVTPAARKNLAQVLLHEHDRLGAAAMLEAAEHDADAQNLGELRWQVRLERAAMARDDGRFEEAERLFDETLDVLEDAQGSVLVEQLRTGALRHALAAADPYDLYVAMLVARGRLDKAFDVAERGRARAFLDTLRAAGDQIARALPREYVEAEASLLADISEGQAALRAGAVTGQVRRDLQAAIRADEEQLTALRLRLTTDLPAVAAARYPRLWRSRDLASQVLRPNQALLAFFTGASGSVAWLVDRAGTRVARLAPEGEIAALARAYLTATSKPGDRSEPSLAARLYRVLFADLTLPDGVDELIVVPHGILCDLPFEPLRDAAGRRLIERVTVAYAPSASSYALLTQGGRPHTPSLLAVGNPVLATGGAARDRGTDVGHLSLLAPLPYTSVEINAIARIYGNGARVLEGEAATEQAVRDADLSSVSILHFATHGVIDEDHPDRSALVLTARPPAEDGVLQVREIYGMRLRGALVTLSACETALGEQVRGEGIIGLSRAFFYAGANLVVASLWNVNDKSTATLMTAFYEALGRGMPAAAALRQAKLSFLNGRQAAMRDPYYWAPFVALGNGAWAAAPAPRPGRGATPARLGAAAAALMLGVIAWLWRRRASRSRW